MRLRKAVALCGSLAVVITFVFFIYSDEVYLDNFLRKRDVVGFLADKYDLMANFDGNHSTKIDEYFDGRKSDKSTKSVVLDVKSLPSASGEINFQRYAYTTEVDQHETYINEYFNQRKQFNLSAVGRYMFLNEPPPEKRSKRFKILIWKIGIYMENRHLYYFHSERHDPFENCSVNNCYLDYDDSSLADADAVAVLLHRLQGAASLPNTTRPEGQRWVFINDESPYNAFTLGIGPWTDLVGIFNWSMTYKADSDIPVPYGRTLPLKAPIQLDGNFNFQSKFTAMVPNANIKRRDVLAAILMSNCGAGNKRFEYLKELQEYMDVDLYGGCGTTLKNSCPGSYGDDCPLLDRYLFYLSFENSNCDEYISEKTFAHSYRKGAVPVIMGSREDVLKVILPPNSYINVYEFATPKDLAEYILRINSTFEDSYLKLHDWRRHLEVVNEHGYFNAPSFHYCRLCEALNYNSQEPKIYGYSELGRFLNPDPNCQ